MADLVAMETPAALPRDIWERTPPEAQAYIGALEARVAALVAMVQALQEQLNQTSGNSSRPPSSDPPYYEHPPRPRSKRRRGGQPGHPGSTRLLIPVEEVDAVVVLQPEQCRHCHAPLSGDAPKPWRHQVSEMPPIKPVVTAYQGPQLVCAGCGEVTRAPWPEGVPSGPYGPRVQATVSLYTGSYRLSKRTTPHVMDEVFGVPMRVGTISQLERATTAAVAAPVEEARRYVHEQEVAHLDETSGRQGGKRAWLWVAVFVVRMSRGGHVARELLGATFAGIVVTDRYSAYTWYPVRWRQLCWAHLLRDIEAMIERGGGSQEIGEALKHQAHKMFHWWHRVRDGTLSRSSFRSYMSPVRREVERLLEAGPTCGVPKTEGMCREILKLRQALWTFVHLAGVEPTNNTAERAIRPGVLWRKGSFGTHSAQGSRFVDSMMTVVATLRQQQRNVLEYLTTACEAALHDAPAPSLLPASPVAPSDQIAA